MIPNSKTKLLICFDKASSFKEILVNSLFINKLLITNDQKRDFYGKFKFEIMKTILLFLNYLLVIKLLLARHSGTVV